MSEARVAGMQAGSDPEGAVVIGTRGSALALAQSGQVADRLRQLHPGLHVELRVVHTAADRAPQLPLAAIGDKGLWVDDLEGELACGSIDMAIHSMKDVPVELAPGMCLGVMPERACPLDAMVLPEGKPSLPTSLADPAFAGAAEHYLQVNEALNRALPRGARVGTSSERRRGQLLLWRPDLEILPVRGNVDTRLRKLDEGQFDCLVLATAGLVRLGRAHRVSAVLPVRRLVPAPGQGMLALEIRQSDARMKAVLAPLHHGPTAAAAAAERTFVRVVAGGCSLPLGAYASLYNQTLELWIRAAGASGPPVQDLDLEPLPETAPYADLRWAEQLGERMAHRFLAGPGRAHLEAAR